MISSESTNERCLLAEAMDGRFTPFFIAGGQQQGGNGCLIFSSFWAQPRRKNPFFGLGGCELGVSQGFYEHLTRICEVHDVFFLGGFKKQLHPRP